MKQFLLLFIFIPLLISCKNEGSTDTIDKIISEIDTNITTGKYNFKKFSEIGTFAQEMTCYFADNKLVCIQAYEGSSYGFSEFNFYVSERKLMYSMIEFTDLKKEYWETMDTVIFNETNSDIIREKTYFISQDIQQVKINSGDIDTLSIKRAKVIQEQFNELYQLSKN